MMKAITVQSKFWNSPKREVIHNVSDNTIQVDKYTYSWDYFFEVNKLVNDKNRNNENE